MISNPSTTARRALHLARTQRDFHAACVLAGESPGSPPNWILSTGGPAPGVTLPPHVEWIRLPATLGTRRSSPTSSWWEALEGLVSALHPDTVYVHAGCLSGDALDVADIQELLPDRVQVQAVPDPGDVHDDGDPGSAPRLPRVGYVLKKFPRYSETFILREILALEAHGVPIQVISLNQPRDGRFHAGLARLGHTVDYLPEKAGSKALQAGRALLPTDARGRAVFTDLFWECIDRGDPALTGYLLQALHVAHRARALELDHLHAHFATSSSEVARMAARLAGISWSMTCHAKDIYADEVDRDGLDRKLRDAAFVVTVCEANRAFLVDRHPGSVDRLTVLYNGVDVDHVTAPAAELDAERFASPVDILAVGRFVEKKGFGLLLDALARLHATRSGLRARILGDGELLEPMRARVRELGLADVVDLPGAASSVQVRAAMRTATLLACPSVVAANGDQDALPTVLLEAQASGLPVVATDVGGIPEIVDGGRAGILVAPDTDALADGIARLLDDPAARSRLVAAGREQVDRLFDLERNASRLAGLFAEASGVHPPPDARGDGPGAGDQTGARS